MLRFIPTRVGNTRDCALLNASRSVHPHACGEYPGGEFFSLESLGSSPRVWGIRVAWRDVDDQARFIPTRVGNTRKSLLKFLHRAVHPHACGEYQRLHIDDFTAHGSSPRVWGIRADSLQYPRVWRFIPTRVGNTRFIPGGGSDLSVHPHACGEYVFYFGVVNKYPGSSPRVWGILVSIARRADRKRFIPTRVGNTRGSGCPLKSATVHPHACGEYTSSISLSYRK